MRPRFCKRFIPPFPLESRLQAKQAIMTYYQWSEEMPLQEMYFHLTTISKIRETKRKALAEGNVFIE